MDLEGFGRLFLDQLPFEPTDQQIQLVAALTRFCSNFTPSDSVFLLNGYAGTGKTSLMGGLVRTLRAVGIPTVLLASTGRAAKVFGNFTGAPAYTIHRKIYRAPTLGPDGRFSARVAENPHVNTVFIVDEASMIGDGADGGADLLSDLVMYVYSGVNCRLILLGDTAQLPPVGMEQSPAMSVDVLKGMGLRVTRAIMTRTVRQKARSGILYNATQLRRALAKGITSAPILTVSPFADVDVVDPEDMEERLRDSFETYGEGQTVVITRSNRRAVDFNIAIRQAIYDREEILARGERLLMAKNNYFWTRRSVLSAAEGEAAGQCHMDFVANGDMAIVEEIYSTEEREMQMFANVRLFFPDHNSRLDAKINLAALRSEAAGISYSDQQLLAAHAMAEAGLPPTASATAVRDCLKADPFYNALQVKYAYALTCHKAQGGQWASVFVDMGYIPPEAYTSVDFFRWLYTASTRATTRLHFLNPSLDIK